MPPPPFLEPSTIDLDHIVADREAVMRINAQRFEFQLLDAVVMMDAERKIFVGYHDVKPDAWWARGHVPGRPLFPGVLMIEAAAQLASFTWRSLVPEATGFLAFAGVDEVKFRGGVQPPARFVLVVQCLKASARRTLAAAQGFVNNQLVFEGQVSGIPV